MKKLVSLILALAMVLTLVGCGAKEEPAATEAAPAETAAPAVETAAAETGEVSTLPVKDGHVPTLDEFVEAIAARKDESKTGNLVIYSTCTEAENDGARRLFEAVYPNINVEFVLGSSSEIAARIEAEAANPQGDVMYGGPSQSSYDSFAHLFDKYLPKGYENLRPEFQTDQNIIWTQFDSPAVMVNNALAEELGFEIKTYEDLLNPALKDWIVSADPTTSSSSRSWFLAALLAHGGVEDDGAWEYVDSLMDNLNGFLAGSSSAGYTMPVTGEYAVGLTFVSATVRAIADGADVSMVVLNPTLAQGYGMGKIKNCPNDENAKLFMDLLLAEEFQSYYTTIGYSPCSAVATVYDDSLSAVTGSMEVIDANWAELSAQTEGFKARWAEVWAAQ